MPKWRIDRSGELLSVRWRWWDSRFVIAALLTEVMVAAAIAMNHPGWALTAATGLYLVLVGLNQTRVELWGHALKVRHGPLPWFRNLDVELRELGEFQVRERRSARGATSWDVYGMKRDGRELCLVRKAPSATLAAWLVHELAEHRTKAMVAAAQPAAEL